MDYDDDTRSLYVAGAFDRVNGDAPCQSIAVRFVRLCVCVCMRECVWCFMGGGGSLGFSSQSSGPRTLSSSPLRRGRCTR